jgi:hypothetical protein
MDRGEPRMVPLFLSDGRRSRFRSASPHDRMPGSVQAYTGVFVQTDYLPHAARVFIKRPYFCMVNENRLK